MLYLTLNKYVNEAMNQIHLLSAILGIPTSQFRIGGSLALAMQIEEFKRTPHDLDIIINVNDKNLESVQKKVVALTKYNGRIGEPVSDDKYSYSVKLVDIAGKKVSINVILDTYNPYLTQEFRPVLFCSKDMDKIYLQHPHLIMAAKMSYIPRREKDLDDIRLILNWESSKPRFAF